MSRLGDVDISIRLLGLALFTFLFVRALLVSESQPVRSARWLLATVGLAALSLLGMVAGLNYALNPFGLYATRLFEPIVLHSRAEKMRLYRLAEPPPDIVVLGNSSGFTMPPAYITEMTRRTAFNASLHGGGPEDYLAFLNYMVSIGKVPKLLIVMLSVEQARPNLPTGFEPHDPLQPYLERSSRHLLAGARWLLTLDQTLASIRVLMAEARGRPAPHYRFDADGWGHFATAEAPPEQLVDTYLAKGWGPELFRFRALDSDQLAYFRRFLERARHLGVKVVVYVPPLHPRAVSLYDRETNLPALRTELLERLHAWQAEGLIAAAYDFSRVESFGGQAGEFHDLAHPTAEASRRMLDVMLRHLPPGL